MVQIMQNPILKIQ